LKKLKNKITAANIGSPNHAGFRSIANVVARVQLYCQRTSTRPAFPARLVAANVYGQV